MRHAPRRRRSRVLLAATGVLSTATLTACPIDSAFGNLKAPDCDANASYCNPEDLKIVDLQEDAPFGNLKLPSDMAPTTD